MKRLILLLLATSAITPAAFAGLIGTYDVNYRWNTAGCGFSDPNPYYCVGSPGPYYISAEPGQYEIIVTEIGPGVGLARMWSGDNSTGTLYELPLGTDFVLTHTSGQIVLYYLDWYPWDNPTDVWTHVEVSSVPEPFLAFPVALVLFGFARHRKRPGV